MQCLLICTHRDKVIWTVWDGTNEVEFLLLSQQEEGRNEINFQNYFLNYFLNNFLNYFLNYSLLIWAARVNTAKSSRQVDNETIHPKSRITVNIQILKGFNIQMNLLLTQWLTTTLPRVTTSARKSCQSVTCTNTQSSLNTQPLPGASSSSRHFLHKYNSVVVQTMSATGELWLKNRMDDKASSLHTKITLNFCRVRRLSLTRSCEQGTSWRLWRWQRRTQSVSSRRGNSMPWVWYQSQSGWRHPRPLQGR